MNYLKRIQGIENVIEKFRKLGADIEKRCFPDSEEATITA